MWVIGRSASSLAGTSVSSSRIGTRPTWATQTAAWTERSATSTVTVERRAVEAARPTQRELGRVEIGLRVLLVAIGVDLLAEVAAPVEEADADERQRRIRCGLAVVAGQHAEAARVDLHRLVDAVLGAEVGDRAGQRPLRRCDGTRSSAPLLMYRLNSSRTRLASTMKSSSAVSSAQRAWSA